VVELKTWLWVAEAWGVNPSEELQTMDMSEDGAIGREAFSMFVLRCIGHELSVTRLRQGIVTCFTTVTQITSNDY